MKSKGVLGMRIKPLKLFHKNDPNNLHNSGNFSFLIVRTYILELIVCGKQYFHTNKQTFYTFYN